MDFLKYCHQIMGLSLLVTGSNSFYKYMVYDIDVLLPYGRKEMARRNARMFDTETSSYCSGRESQMEGRTRNVPFHVEIYSSHNHGS